MAREFVVSSLLCFVINILGHKFYPMLEQTNFRTLSEKSNTL